MTDYLYWTFECKTPDCKTVVAFLCGGVHTPKQSPLIFSASNKPVSLFCPKCKQSHEYNESEFQPEISAIEPSPDFPHADSKRVS